MSERFLQGRIQAADEIYKKTDLGLMVPTFYTPEHAGQGKVKNIVFYGELDDAAVGTILTQLIEADENPEVEEILFTMGTPGGNLDAVRALHDQITLGKKPVDILATGECMSSGPVLLQATRKRIANPHTIFMLHPASFSPSGLHGEVIPSVEQSRKNAITHFDFLLARCGMPREEFESLFSYGKLEIHLDVHQAKAFGRNGLIDEIRS